MTDANPHETPRAQDGQKGGLLSRFSFVCCGTRESDHGPDPVTALASPSWSDGTTQASTARFGVGHYKITRRAALTDDVSLTGKLLQHLPVETQVEVLEVVELKPEANRIRGRLRDPAGWISLQSVTGGEHWIKPIPVDDVVDFPASGPACGAYVMVAKGAVGESASITGKQIGMVDEGAFVDVLEVHEFPADDRVRAKIRSPAGYISIKMMKGDFVWAKPRATSSFQSNRG